MRRLAIAGAAVVLLLARAAVAAASGWSIQDTPTPTGGSDISLLGVSCVSASACTAVGYYDDGPADVTLAERWNGIRWSIQHTPNPTGSPESELLGVSCASASACTAVGFYQKPPAGSPDLTLVEHWNGTKWSIQDTPGASGRRELRGVSCASASACIAVGGYNNGTTSVTLAERWDGTKWSIQHTPNPTGGLGISLRGVSCASASACTAVGDYFSGTATVTLAERWNGTKWSIQHTPNPTGTSLTFLPGVSCASASACTAVGSYFNGTATVTLAERWNGTKWSIQHTQNPTGSTYSELFGVSCASASACTAVSYTDGGSAAAQVTLAERWNGTKWSIQHTPSPTGGKDIFLPGVSCASASACTAVGYYYNGTTNVPLAERWTG
jgi:hypothetical protein